MRWQKRSGLRRLLSPTYTVIIRWICNLTSVEGDLRETEVSQLNVSFVTDQHVVRLQISEKSCNIYQINDGKLYQTQLQKCTSGSF